ncbi:hypothetical protein [Christiangramia sabulilitoris]|uniref:Uncharacterized protein n=1 Tax=Christiangramia sabulilitoris TaxID=2583991 RepID=A0A550I3F4_9FLAO|nr:hypothetical protein [Christiangramia sabulilitoris]TRO65517.1 hypothetical protein FGM01_08950 [Christiangramia sabulilitoris]
MRITYYSLLILFFILGCKTTETTETIFKEGKTFENFRGFKPVDPTEFNDNIQLVSDGELGMKDLRLLNSEEILGFLNNETVLVSIGQLSSEGRISYIPFAISQKNTSYKVTMDYMKYATLGQEDNRNNFIGYKRVGVGLRLISLITTAEAGINISDLYSIGLAAKAGKLSGTLMIEIIGIKSKDVTTLLPLPSEINQTTIQNAMQALATIKSKIYDEDTRLYPQVMAIKLDENARSRSIPVVSMNSEDDEPFVEMVQGQGPGSIDILQAEEEVDKSIQLQFQNNKVGSSGVAQRAAQLEKQALESLMNKEVEEAIEYLRECEIIYPQYHSVYEVLQLLKQNRRELAEKNSPKWQELYSEILKNFSWRLPESIRAELKALADQ